MGSVKSTSTSVRLLVMCAAVAASAGAILAGGQAATSPQSVTLPDTPMTYGAFTATFGRDGSFVLSGQGWPPLKGAWKAVGDALELTAPIKEAGCDGAGLYGFRLDGTRLMLTLRSDACPTRKLVLDGSSWVPVGTLVAHPPRRIVRTAGATGAALPDAAPAKGSWPSFRGVLASGVADGQNLPDRWDVATGENILWRVQVPGLGHSSPIVWGDRLFVATAVSSDPKAGFRKGLYGDGDASTD